MAGFTAHNLTTFWGNNTMKLNCIHADTCLSDYWGGHHLPHIAVPVWQSMTITELRDALRGELRQGAVMGSCDDARLLSADMIWPNEEKRADMLTRAAYAAIARDVRMARRGKRKPFADLDDSTNDGDGYSVMAYFVFREADA